MSKSLLKTFDAIPVGAFTGKAAKDPRTLLPRLFGKTTTVRPFIRATDMGAWQGGWTVLIRTKRGLAALVIDEVDEPQGWVEGSRWTRMRMLHRALSSPTRTKVDALDLASWCSQRLRLNDGTGFTSTRVTNYTGLSEQPEGWLLRHLLADLDADEATTVWTMLALGRPEDEVARTRQVLTALDHLSVNVRAEEEVESVFVAVSAERGTPLTGYDIEKRDLGQTLLAHPREEWPAVADALLEATDPLHAGAEADRIASRQRAGRGGSGTGRSRSGSTTYLHALAV